jgi:hypothetical protein
VTACCHSMSDPDVIRDIRHSIYTLRRCVLVAGAGLSAQACTPSGSRPPLWAGLLNGMVDWCVRYGFAEPALAEQIDALIQAGYLTEAGQEIEEIFREKSLEQQCLREVLMCNEAMLSDAHTCIATIPFRAYLTTNYDMLIESAYSQVTKRSMARFYERSIDSVLEEYREGRTFILKLHGDIDDAESIILGDRGYERLLHSGTRYRDCLHALISMSSVLFVGFGGTDPDLDGLLSKVAAFDGRRRRHWMVVPEGKFPTLKAKRLLHDKGVRVIEYPIDAKHSRLTEFLGILATPPGGLRAQDEESALREISGQVAAEPPYFISEQKFDEVRFPKEGTGAVSDKP